LLGCVTNRGAPGGAARGETGSGALCSKNGGVFWVGGVAGGASPKKVVFFLKGADRRPHNRFFFSPGKKRPN